MDPIPFSSPAVLHKWYVKNHEKETELWLKFFKTGSGIPSVTYPEALDEALSFGWIDGVRKSLGPDSYVIRYTPRRKTSIWSQVNLRRYAELEKLGRIQAAGKKTFDSRDPEKVNRYSFEQGELNFNPTEEKIFRKNKKAWKFFESSPRTYRKAALWWVVGAKKEETRKKRFAQLLLDSENELRLKHLVPTSARRAQKR